MVFSQRDLAVLLFGTIHQDLLLSFYSNIFLVFLFVLATHQLHTLRRLHAHFKLRELDFYRRQPPAEESAGGFVSTLGAIVKKYYLKMTCRIY